MVECDLLDVCGFFQKFQTSQSAACNSFIKEFCKGPKQDRCKRKAYRKEHGVPPHDNMMPVGGMLPDEL